MAKGKENKIQAAITGALQVYAEQRSLHIFPPYANQQGDGLRKYCGDLFGVLEDADLIILEIKALDVTSGNLQAFDMAQHEAAKRFEELKVPLAYAYNAIENLPYHKRPQPADWAKATLQAIKRSTPTLLPGPAPTATDHQSLLEWLEGEHTSHGTELFGRINGALNQVDDLRNGVLVLLYSVAKSRLAAFTTSEISIMMKVLQNNSSLDKRHLDQISTITGESAKVFAGFTLPTTKAGQSASKISRPKNKKL